jgi:ubiquinone/menaquinone biosynthesis C-methylase UbiE
MAGNSLLHVEKLLGEIGPLEGLCVAEFGPDRNGHLIFPLARVVGGAGHVFAVDLLPAVLQMIDSKRAHEAYVNVSCVRGDFERFEGVAIPNAKLDAIMVVNNLWCLKSIPGLLREAKRLLKRDGRLVLIDWQKEAEHPVAPPMECRMSPAQVEKVFAEEGFAKDHDLTVNQVHWGMVFRQS